MSQHTFTITVSQDGNNTGIIIPKEIIEALGTSKRPRIKLTLNDKYSYSTTVAMWNGNFAAPFNSARREESGINGGDTIKVTVELDTAPQIIEIPEDLKKALEAATLLDIFENSAPSKRKEFVRQVNDAKTQETRERRIQKVVDTLK